MKQLRIGKPETPELFDEHFDRRWRILRAPWDRLRGSKPDELDEIADHVTVRHEDARLLGIGRLHMNNAQLAQIRYKATEEFCRGFGIGRALMGRLEEIAIGRGAERIVLNARSAVVGFYQRFDFAVTGPGPTLFDKLKHSRTEKRILRRQ